MLYSETDESLGSAIVHANGDADDHGTLGHGEPLQNTLVEVHIVRDRFELTASHLVRWGIFEDRDRLLHSLLGWAGNIIHRIVLSCAAYLVRGSWRFVFYSVTRDMGIKLIVGCGYLGSRIASLWLAGGHQVF